MGRGRIKDTSHLSFLRERLGDSLMEIDCDQCCGAPLELSSPVTAGKMLDRKIAGVEDSGCGGVLSDCPFCVLALGSSISRPVKHILGEIEA
jgi:Fe-S oxidoreductase